MDGLTLNAIMEDDAPKVVVADEAEATSEAEQMTDMDAELRVEKINMWEAYRKKWVEHYEKLIAQVNERVDRNIAWNKHILRKYFSLVPHKGTKTTLYYDGLLSSHYNHGALS